MLSQELLEILRCPFCASSLPCEEGDDPGQLDLAHGAWLVCQESGCNRKYPIVDDIPHMLIEIGDKYASTSVEELGEPEE